MYLSEPLSNLVPSGDFTPLYMGGLRRVGFQPFKFALFYPLNVFRTLMILPYRRL
jgi:hypothetical protein